MKIENRLALIPFLAVLSFGIIYALLAASQGPFIHDIDPTLVKLGPIEIRYYGLVYMLGFLLVFYLLRGASRRKTIALNEEDLEKLVLLLILGVIIGARLFEVLIYNPGYYLKNPLEIFAVWEGGLSFHGGLAGVLLVTWLFSRKSGRPSFITLIDTLALPALAILAFGRLANFINGELWGGLTDLSWGVEFKRADGFRHPTQIYESFKNALSFGILYFIRSFSPKPGVLSCVFLISYGGFRFFIEFFKDYGEYGYDTVSFSAINVAHLLCLGMILIGVVGLLMIRRTSRQEG